MNVTIKTTTIAALLFTTMLAPQTSGATEPARNDDQISTDLIRSRKRLRFEVAENATRFAFDEAPVAADGMPTYGNPFITKGFIYPAGTLKDTDGDGALDNGVVVETDDNGNTVVRPEFPDKVIGLWICRGAVMADEGFAVPTGPTVNTTQLYDFHVLTGGFGRVSLISEGLELIDQGVGIARAITGGTGKYRRARGEVLQTFAGVNASGGFNLTFEVVVSR